MFVGGRAKSAFGGRSSPGRPSGDKPCRQRRITSDDSSNLKRFPANIGRRRSRQVSPNVHPILPQVLAEFRRLAAARRRETGLLRGRVFPWARSCLITQGMRGRIPRKLTCPVSLTCGSCRPRERSVTSPTQRSAAAGFISWGVSGELVCASRSAAKCRPGRRRADRGGASPRGG